MASANDVKAESDQELVAWGLDIEKGLTDWEIRFLEDMESALSEGPLSAGRRTKLEQIIIEKG